MTIFELHQDIVASAPHEGDHTAMNPYDFVSDRTGKIYYSKRFGIIEEREKSILCEYDESMMWLPKSVIAYGDRTRDISHLFMDGRSDIGLFVAGWFVESQDYEDRFSHHQTSVEIDEGNDSFHEEEPWWFFQ